MAAEATKQCRICEVVKPLSKFHKNTNYTGGHMNTCADCRNASRRQPKEILPEGFARCTRCLQIKASGEFPVRLYRKKNGLASWCRQCNRDFTKENPLNTILNSSRHTDKSKGMYNDQKFITFSFLMQLYSHQKGCCWYCGRTLVYGLEVHRYQHPDGLTIERKDNKLGHNQDNVVFACHRCNFERCDRYTFDEFVELINQRRKAQLDAHLVAQQLSKLTIEPNKITLEFKSS